MDKELRPVAKWARSQGWDVQTDSDGYTKFYTPEGKWVYSYPVTAGRPRRRWQELKLALRAEGLKWPPPSKSEQRSRRQKGGDS